MILVVKVAAGVEFQAVERLQIEAKTDRPLGVAGLEVELETLAPIANAVGLGVAVHHVTPMPILSMTAMPM